MFLETQPQGQPVKEKKPSELLREGIPLVEESSTRYLEQVDGVWLGCANGTMAYAAGVRENAEAARWACNKLGPEMKSIINILHSHNPYVGGFKSREEIADWLEAQGK